jgi:allantoinase
VARLAPEIRAEDAGEVFDAKRLLAFPGCVDAHMHVGIYRPLAEDAVSESKAAAMGGVTSSLNYIRTGAYYLNRGGPYREVMPEVRSCRKAASGSTTAITWRRSKAGISARWSTSRSNTG